MTPHHSGDEVRAEPSVPWRKAEVRDYFDAEIDGAKAKIEKTKSHRVKDKAKARLATLSEVRDALFGVRLG